MLSLDRRDRVTDVESGQSKASVLCPWIENPYALISWWDMEKFSADAFFLMGKLLERIRLVHTPQDIASKSGLDGVRPLSSIPDIPAPRDAVEGLKALLEAMSAKCKEISLKFSLKAINGLYSELDQSLTNRKIADRLEQLEQLIKWEMEDSLFLYVPSDRAEYYSKEDGFGVGVGSKFPSAKFDIAEGGNCFAAGRFTGCVFHLMRVLEIGLAALGKVFSVSLAHTNWHPAIEEIEKKVRDMGNSPNKAPDWKEQQEYYSQAASHFMFLKDAWRNYTAHARGKYTEQEAKTIFINVGAFMQKLSERLAE
jgi:hypothetical protein